MKRGIVAILAAVVLSSIPLPVGANSLESLLLSGPWCSFSYNATTGHGSSSRVLFYANGTCSLGQSGEGYSSGYGGTFGSQPNSGADGYWQVQNGTLFLSEGNGLMEMIETVVTANSIGYPVIVADGVEYTRCQ